MVTAHDFIKVHILLFYLVYLKITQNRITHLTITEIRQTYMNGSEKFLVFLDIKQTIKENIFPCVV